ncbi:MAG: Tryptophan synthase alpha chain [Labilithrix sp.]|nr:Tryptophan synthase alpha chain [Labilithrix sp.]
MSGGRGLVVAVALLAAAAASVALGCNTLLENDPATLAPSAAPGETEQPALHEDGGAETGAGGGTEDGGGTVTAVDGGADASTVGTCEAGACAPGCGPEAPLTCGGSCVDPLTNTSHCGTCGTACVAGANGAATCTNGICGVACQEGFGDCNADALDGCEADLRTSTASCGACGKHCGVLDRCVNGDCKLFGIGIMAPR